MNSKALESYKPRSSNFTKDETLKLVNLIEKYNIITNKNTDHATIYKKEVAWKKVFNEFNEGATTPRTGKQLQNKFDNMKRKVRTEMKRKATVKDRVDDQRQSKLSSPVDWSASITGESISGRLSTDEDSDYISEFHPSSKECTATFKIEKQGNEDDSESPTEERCEFINVDCDGTPTSEELDTTRKRKILFTQNMERKYMHLGNTNAEIEIDKINSKESLMNMFLEEEHKQKLRHKQDLHEVELEYKRNLYKLTLDKMKIEIEIEKQKLKSFLT